MGEALSPSRWTGQTAPLTALLSFALLAGDVLLPVPASLVMVANGALFGLGAGALLSTLGGLAASLLGYALGHRLRAVVDRLVPDEVARSQEALERWGLAAVALSRPLPLLAETVAVAAGAAGFRMGRFAVGSLLGTLPAAMVFAALGAAGAQGTPLPLLVAAYVVTALLTVGVERRLRRPPAAGRSGDGVSGAE